MSQPSRLRPERTPQFKSMQVLRKRLMAAGHLEPSTPKHMKRIVVIGSQSAGKSALVSMLTGIKLESSIKATTRGPTVFRFVKGEEQGGYRVWSEFVEDAEGTAFASPVRGDEEVCRKADVPAKIKDLHRSVLRPEFDEFGDYIDSQDISSDQRLADIDPSYFTNNTVVIEKVAPDMPDMEIIDLPGLQVSSNLPETMEKIKGMTLKYIDGPNTFVLAVCPANSEPESQSVLNIVRDKDPALSRTIVTLSRSDQMTGNECAWHDLLSRHSDSFCFVASSIPSGLRETLEQLEASERLYFTNQRKSNTNYVHQVDVNVLGIDGLLKVLKAKILAVEKALLLSALSKLRSELALLTESSGQWKRAAVIGEINAHIDIAAREYCKTLRPFEISSHQDRDRFCERLSILLHESIPNLEHLEIDLCSMSFQEIVVKIQKDWTGFIDSHQQTLWRAILSEIQSAVSRSVPSPQGLCDKICSAATSLVEKQQSASQVFLQVLTQQYCSIGSVPLGTLTCDSTANDRYHQLFIAPDMVLPMIPLGPTPPQTPPASLKRKRSDHDDPRVNLKRDTELEQTRQVKIHIDLACERLLYGVQDHLSHAIASLAYDGVAHSLREKVGTNRVLTLEAAASIMAQSTEEAAKSQNMMAELKRLIEVGEQARLEE